ncbi:MAG: rdd [uncultured bacterium]|nr:MAG: rdd [uncultured bacterium]
MEETKNDLLKAGVQENVNEQPESIIKSSETSSAPDASQAGQATAVEYAGFWVRFAAALVDGLILIIPVAIANVIFAKTLGGQFAGTISMWAYAIYMLNTRQATFGKMALGIKVISVDGKNATVGKLALREIVGKILNFLTLYIGFIMVAFTAKKQGLHDMIAGTVVVYDPARKRRAWLVVVGIVFALIIPIMGILAAVVWSV